MFHLAFGKCNTSLQGTVNNDVFTPTVGGTAEPTWTMCWQHDKSDIIEKTVLNFQKTPRSLGPFN